MKLAIIGDYDSGFVPHVATNEAIGHSLNELGRPLAFEWITTDRIETEFDEIVANTDGYWIAPGSPYRSMAGALQVIRHAREHNIPVLGTCGGFQHMAIEFARNVLDVVDAEHAEYDPYASRLVVNPLSCSLAGQELPIRILDTASRTYGIYASTDIVERYYCNFGLNPEYQTLFHDRGFRVVGTGDEGEARILELANHDFFIATLFVPQTNSTSEHPHKLVTAFVRSVLERHRSIA